MHYISCQINNKENNMTYNCNLNYSPVTRSSSFFNDLLDYYPNFSKTNYCVDSSTSKSSLQTPRSSIREKDNEILVEIALPGIEKKDIEIEVKNSILSIKTKNEIKNETEKSFQFDQVQYQKSFQISDAVEKNSIKATHTNGILQVAFTKKTEAIAQKIGIQ